MIAPILIQARKDCSKSIPELSVSVMDWKAERLQFHVRVAIAIIVMPDVEKTCEDQFMAQFK
jgi:hypothetical protein